MGPNEVSDPELMTTADDARPSIDVAREWIATDVMSVESAADWLCRQLPGKYASLQDAIDAIDAL